MSARGPDEPALSALDAQGPCSVEGRVVDAHGAPLADVPVLVYRPALVGDSPASPFSGPAAWSVPRARVRQELARGSTGEGGTYRIDGLPPGVAIVRVLPGPGLDAVRETELAPGAPARVDAACAPFAWVTGRVLTPPGPLDKLQVLVGADGVAGDCLPEMWEPHAESVVAAVQPDGAFRAGPLPGGAAKLVVLWRTTGVWSDVIELAARRVELTPEREAEIELDLRARYPGTLRVHLVIDGAPAPGNWVTLSAAGRSRSGWGRTTSRRGVAELVGAGGEHHVWIEAGDGSFRHRVDEPATVPPGSVARLQVDLRLAPGTLRVLDAATGSPLRRTFVTVLAGDASDHRPLRDHLVTDDTGAVELVCPVGARLRVGRAGDRALETGDLDALAAVEWTRAGPRPAEVALGRR